MADTTPGARTLGVPGLRVVPGAILRVTRPDEAISTSPALFQGTDRHRRFMRQRLDAVTGTAAGGENIYVSRSALGLHRSGLLSKDRIESSLAAEGYRIFHPPAVSLADQIATYRAARRIIGVELSGKF